MDLKCKEVETLQEMVARINSEELNPRQCYEVVKEVTQLESQIPEMKQVIEEFDYESIRMMLAAGVRMKHVYDVNM